MKGMTLRAMTQAVNGIYHGNGEDYDKEITAITIDSRKVAEGGLFIAIKGERSDGHDFIGQCFEKGAACVISEKELPDEERSYIKVESSLQALKDLALLYRNNLDVKVVGITGSVGKTSTKETISSVLSEKYRVLKTLGNFNNEIGLPLTVFRLTEDDEVAVLEMGISDFGEMHRLASIAQPNTCVITNIGTCHLENLGDRDGVLKAKTEVFDHLKPDATVILNGDDDKLVTVKEVQGRRPIYFGLNEEFPLYADEIESKGLKGIACRIHTPKGTFSVVVPIPGHHMVYNALAGTAVGLAYGMELSEIQKGIESLQSLSGRFHIIENEKYTIVDDCYNANPMSMKASLDILKDAMGRKVAILGDMGELGENEKELHREVGTFAGNCGIDLLICVGTLAKEIAEAAKESSIQAEKQLEAVSFDTLEELLMHLGEQVKQGDTILVKASHFMNFGKIVEALQK